MPYFIYLILRFIFQEEMLPILYKHQAIGDDFFVDLADKKLGCYVSDEGEILVNYYVHELIFSISRTEKMWIVRSWTDYCRVDRKD